MHVSGYSLQVTGYSLQVAGYSLQVTGYMLQVSGYSLQVTGYMLQVSGYSLQVAGYSLQVAGYSFAGVRLKLAGGRLQLNIHAPYDYMASNKVTFETGAGLHGVHRTCAETAAVSRTCLQPGNKQSNSVVNTPLRWLVKNAL